MSIDHDCKSYSLMTLPCSWFQLDRFGNGLPVQEQRYLVDMWNMFLNPVLHSDQMGILRMMCPLDSDYVYLGRRQCIRDLLCSSNTRPGT